jgi:hypothetical protein
MKHAKFVARRPRMKHAKFAARRPRMKHAKFAARRPRMKHAKLNLFLRLIKYHAMKAYVGVEVAFQNLLTSTLDGH